MLEDTMEVTAMTRLRAAPPVGGSLRILFCKWGQDDYNDDGDEKRDKRAERDTVQP